MKLLVGVILTKFLLINLSYTKNYTPIVLWHGLGDRSESYGIQGLIDSIKTQFPGIYVKSLLANNSVIDFVSGAFLSATYQVDAAIDIIKNDDQLKDGYIGIGLSQGGLFLRALIQKCSQPSAKVLITLGSPHQGVFGLNRICNASSTLLCEFIYKEFSKFAYSKWAQKLYTPTNYWHDPFDENSYLNNCTFLPKINHELENIQSEKENFMKLNKLILVKFKDDTVLTPSISAWFGFYKTNTTHIIPYSKTNFYYNNKLGFQDMVVNGKVHFIEIPGDHLDFSDQWLCNILKPYLEVYNVHT